MELSNPLKMIPSQYYLPLALVAGGLLAWRFLFSGGSSESSPSNTALGYDPSLVALGVETSLERDRLNANTELGKLAMQTELQAMDKQYGFLGIELASNERTTQRHLDSAERVRGAEIGLNHAELGVMNHLGMLAEQTAQRVAEQTAWSTVESARVTGDAAVRTAKASKKKSFGFKGFSLSL